MGVSILIQVDKFIDEVCFNLSSLDKAGNEQVEENN